MKTIYSLSSVLFCSIVFAQTTITKAANDYISGNTINELNMVGTPDNSSTGSSVTFNNSALTAGSAITATVSTPTAAEITSYPGTTVKFSDGNGNDIFYKSTATDLQITGATVSGAVLNFTTNNAIFLKWPTVYAQSYTDPASGSATYTGTTLYFNGNITTIADATGTLQVGNQTFANVIRTKTTQNYTLYFDPTFFASAGTLVSTIYTYYDNAHRYPLFTTTTAVLNVPIASIINQTSEQAVAQSLVFLGNQEVAAQKSLFMYPNPATDVVKFDGLEKDQQWVKVFSADGRLVAKKKLNNNEINISELNSGNYFISVSGDKSETKAMKLIKK